MSHEDDDMPMSEDMYEKLALALKPFELGQAQRRELRERMLRQARNAADVGTITVRAGEDAWIDVAPFLQMKVLRRDQAAGNQTVLMRMQPGGVVPPHRHSQEEEFAVLEGECAIGSLTLRPGDVHIAPAGSWHDAVTTRTGVLVLLRGEYPMPTPDPMPVA